MDLHFKKNGSGPPLIVLHGLFGSSDNWHSVGRILSQHFTVYLLDARNHVHSPHDKEHTYDAMVEDLLHFIERNVQQPVVLLGHSMGGKTAMSFALQYPQWVERMIVVDISPRSYSALQTWSHQPLDLMNIAMAMRSVELEKVHSRNDADLQMSSWIPDRNLRAFLLKNLVRTESDGFRWCLNLEVLYKSIHRMIADWNDPAREMKNESLKALFIKGAKSDYISAEDTLLIKALFPQSEIVTIPDAGHWPHAEQPVLFMNYLGLFLEIPASEDV